MEYKHNKELVPWGSPSLGVEGIDQMILLIRGLPHQSSDWFAMTKT